MKHRVFRAGLQGKMQGDGAHHNHAEARLAGRRREEHQRRSVAAQVRVQHGQYGGREGKRRPAQAKVHAVRLRRAERPVQQALRLACRGRPKKTKLGAALCWKTQRLLIEVSTYVA